MYRKGESMPTSLRLSPDIEAQIASFAARQKIAKSAVIVRSIQEFLARNAPTTEPSSFEIYEAAMRDAQAVGSPLAEPRPHKQLVQSAITRKHAARSKRAALGLAQHKVSK
jgi:predicted transcriptional regulator